MAGSVPLLRLQTTVRSGHPPFAQTLRLGSTSWRLSLWRPAGALTLLRRPCPSPSGSTLFPSSATCRRLFSSRRRSRAPRALATLAPSETGRRQRKGGREPPRPARPARPSARALCPRRCARRPAVVDLVRRQRPRRLRPAAGFAGRGDPDGAADGSPIRSVVHREKHLNGREVLVVVV